MQLRPYQVETINAVEQAFREFQRVLVVKPTGSGKTISFAKLAQRHLPGRTLILAHRDELIEQALDKISISTGISASKEKAEYYADSIAPVVVASIQTMTRRLSRWPSQHFSLVIADEAHHAISKSWQRVLNHFHHAKVLGVTATPDRGDKRTLGQYFEAVAYEISLTRLIQEKYLCPITIKCLPLSIDLSKVHLLGGDFSDRELGHAIEPYLTRIAKSIAEHAEGRRILAFLPLIDTSRKFVDACRDAGIHAEHIDGNSRNRQLLLEDFAHGKMDLLSNAMLLTEGYDNPAIDCIVVLRPTKSRPLFAQMVGRGTRISPYKDNLLLLDFLWLHERHRIVHPADLLAKEVEEADAITELSKKAGSQEELDLLDLSSQVTEERERKLRERLQQLAQRKAKFVSAEQFCVQSNACEVAFYEETMRWESKPITDAQKKYLERAHIDIETVRGRGHASALLDIYFKKSDLQLATEKQRWVMYNHGIPDAHKATRAQARAFFTRLNELKKANPA